MHMKVTSITQRRNAMSVCDEELTQAFVMTLEILTIEIFCDFLYQFYNEMIRNLCLHAF
jgi:hypothetical protein